MFGASQCMRTWHPCLWLGERTWGSGHGGAFAEGRLLACVNTSGVCPMPWASSCMALQSVSVWSCRVVVLAEFFPSLLSGGKCQ